MSLNIAFFVPGQARPAGSKNSFVPKDKHGNPYRRPNGGIVVSTVDSSGEKGKAWRTDVRDAAGKAFHCDPVSKVALELVVVFVVKRPQAHYRSNGSLKADAPPFPLKDPDTLKMARSVEDALQGVIYAEDNCNVWLRFGKVYGNRPGAHIRVHEIVDVYDVVRQMRALMVKPDEDEPMTPREIDTALFPTRAGAP